MCQKSSKLEECEFKWGKKRGIGGKQKEVQFYDSFTYDGDEYSLYDNVYLHKDGEPEPYIGKLVKIWEQPGQKKKVKVLWFFRPVEIHNFLEEGTTPENELFLASGVGKGLTNINQLEAVAGKCHVVCTSKDSRNPQPSPEEVKLARYIFYRTFNVENGSISDKIDDKIAGVEVRFLFNREGGQLPNGTPELGAVLNEENEKKVADKNLKSGNDSTACNDKPSTQARVGSSAKLSNNQSPSLEVNKDKKGNTKLKKRKANTDEKSKAPAKVVKS